MKLREFFKKVMFNIEAKTWRYRKKILFSLIDTEVAIYVYHDSWNKKRIQVYDVIKSKLLAELEIETFGGPVNNFSRYYLNKYKAYK